MKKIITYLVVGILLGNCSEAVKKPSNLIPKEKMIDIFYDMNLLQTIRNNDFRLYQSYNINPEQYIYTKYNIDSLQFVQSNKYYALNTEEYEKMLDVVIERIEAEQEKFLESNPENIEDNPQVLNDSLTQNPPAPVN